MTRAVPLSIYVRVDPDAVVAQVIGELDLSTGSVIRESLQPFFGRAPRVIFELEEVSFIDSAGVESLFSAVENGEAISIRRPSQPVQRVLQLLELEAAIEGATRSIAHGS